MLQRAVCLLRLREVARVSRAHDLFGALLYNYIATAFGLVTLLPVITLVLLVINLLLIFDQRGCALFILSFHHGGLVEQV